MNIKLPPIKFVAKIFIILFSLILIIAFIIFPAALAYYATRSARSNVDNIPEGFEDVIIKTDDYVTLRAWYRKPENGKVIIVIHGSGSSRDSMREYIEMFVKNDYGVFAFDLRGHGESEGKSNRVGWQGTKDISAAVAYLKEQPEVKSIGGFGSSLGGEVLLGAAYKNPEIKVIVSEGATFRTFNEFYDYRFTSPVIQNVSTLKVQDFFISMINREEIPEKTLVQSIKESNAKFMYIAAGNVENERNYNKLFYDASADRSKLWIIENVGHIGGLSKDSSKFEQEVITFFNDNFGK